jgi:hypothetical protein
MQVIGGFINTLVLQQSQVGKLKNTKLLSFVWKSITNTSKG